MGKNLAVLLVALLFVYSVNNIADYIQASQAVNKGNSILSSELAAIDYVYQKAEGKNFKVYTYLPSVYDYPYQYLFWWHGLSKYGYLPEDYAYSPDKPPYINQKEKFDNGNHPESSGLVFLIKEPDQNGIRHLWENTFRDLPLISSERVGPLEIEIRQDLEL